MPTVGGMVLFGGERLEHFPDAWIQAGRFAGTNKARIQDHVDLTGHLISAIEDAAAFVQKHMERGVSRLRNRVIGRVFNELGLIEQWGSGIACRTGACEDAGLAHPEFEEIGFRFRVTLYTKPAGTPKADPFEQAILDFLKDDTGHTTAEIAETMNRSTRANRTRLVSLIGRGMVKEIGTGPRDPRRRYYLAGSS